MMAEAHRRIARTCMLCPLAACAAHRGSLAEIQQRSTVRESICKASLHARVAACHCNRRETRLSYASGARVTAHAVCSRRSLVSHTAEDIHEKNRCSFGSEHRHHCGVRAKLPAEAD